MMIAFRTWGTAASAELLSGILTLFAQPYVSIGVGGLFNSVIQEFHRQVLEEFDGDPLEPASIPASIRVCWMPIQWGPLVPNGLRLCDDCRIPAHVRDDSLSTTRTSVPALRKTDPCPGVIMIESRSHNELKLRVALGSRKLDDRVRAGPSQNALLHE
jgi:hypothetical protein